MQKLFFLQPCVLQNVWFYVSFVEFFVIVILLLRMMNVAQKQHEIKKEILSTNNINYDNIIQSSFSSKPLYDLLKKKCHPDKFLDKEKNVIATEIFAKIVENKYNYQSLLIIKEEAETKLNIKI